MSSKRNRPDGAPSFHSPFRPPTRVSRAADVSRETAPTAIARETREIVARWLSDGAFSLRAEFLGRIEAMAATLALWGSTTNLTADASDPTETAFHVIDSLAPIVFASDAIRAELESAVGSNANVLDLGSGAGFPGIVLAAAFEARFTLAEARRKRVSYLRIASNEMGLANVAIQQRKLNVSNVATEFDLVTTRAFGAGGDMYAIAATALRTGGLMLLYASEDQIRGDHRALTGGFEGPLVWKYHVPHGDRIAKRAAILWRKSLKK